MHAYTHRLLFGTPVQSNATVLPLNPILTYHSNTNRTVFYSSIECHTNSHTDSFGNSYSTDEILF